MFRRSARRIIDADEIARIVGRSPAVSMEGDRGRVRKDILEPGGAIDGKTRDIVFSDEAGRKRLNEITHPRIMEKIRGLVRVYEKEGAPVVMIEAALIVEKGGLKGLIDTLIVVTADEETQIRRLMEGKGYSREEAVSRLRAQMPAREKMIHGDYIIDNSGSLEDTRPGKSRLRKRSAFKTGAAHI
jgi:dephospho-CoA kinase